MTTYKKLYIAFLVISIIGFIVCACSIDKSVGLEYDIARDLSRVATFMTLLFMLAAPIRWKGKMVAVIGVPMIIHFMGTFYINNF